MNLLILIDTRWCIVWDHMVPPFHHVPNGLLLPHSTCVAQIVARLQSAILHLVSCSELSEFRQPCDCQSLLQCTPSTVLNSGSYFSPCDAYSKSISELQSQTAPTPCSEQDYCHPGTSEQLSGSWEASNNTCTSLKLHFLFSDWESHDLKTSSFYSDANLRHRELIHSSAMK